MKRTIILLLALLFCLSGCGQRTTVLPTADPEEIAVNQEGGSYQAETDSQFFWGREGNQSGLAAALITAGNGGYYFFDSSLLCFYDPESGNAYPLCSRPNCSHDNESCDAYWGSYNILSIQYVNKELYLLGSTMEETTTLLLMRVQMDGSGREKMYEICQTEDYLSCSALIHRGYLYYTIDLYVLDLSTENSAMVFRRRLDGQGDVEELYKSKAYYGCKIELQAYGDYLYIQETGYTDEDASDYTGSIGRLSIHTLKYEPLKEEAFYAGFAVSGSTLYFSGDTQLIALQMDTGEESTLYETGMPVYLAFDGTNLWLDNDCGLYVLEDAAPTDQRTITVLSTDGTVVQELPLEESGLTVLFGDGEQLFVQVSRKRDDGYEDLLFYAADKKDILNGSLNWSVLYDP